MDQWNFDEKAVNFFKDKKNTAIVILSILVFVLTGGIASKSDTIKTIEASSTVSNLDERIESLNNQIEEANEKIRTLEDNNQTLSKEKEELTAKINNMSSVEELQKTLNEKNQYILNLEAQVGSLTAEKTQLETQNGILQQQVGTTKKTNQPTTSPSNSETVYITNTGSKYHRGSCSYLRNSKHAIDKDDAISQGYTPCSRCNP